MLQNQLNDLKENLNQNLKLTHEEIRQFKDFKSSTEQELDEISELIFQLSLLMYKSHKDE